MSSQASTTNAAESLDSEALKKAFRESLAQLPEMKSVSELIEQSFRSDAPLLREIPSYLFVLGGKRIRPALCLMVAHAFSKDLPSITEALVHVSAGIEPTLTR